MAVVSAAVMVVVVMVEPIFSPTPPRSAKIKKTVVKIVTLSPPVRECEKPVAKKCHPLPPDPQI